MVKKLSIVVALVLLSLSVAPALAGAQQFSGPQFQTTGPQFQTNGPGGLQNPLKVTSICQLVNALFNLMLVFGIPLATFFLVYAGFRLIIARGNPEALKKARLNLFYVLVGIAIFMGAWMLARVIAATIQSLNIDVPGLNNCA